jgi:Uri superfamily endonuclease
MAMTIEDRIETFLEAAEALAAACDQIREGGACAKEAYELFATQIKEVEPRLSALRAAINRFAENRTWGSDVLDAIVQSAEALQTELDGLIDYAETLADAMELVETAGADDEAVRAAA